MRKPFVKISVSLMPATPAPAGQCALNPGSRWQSALSAFGTTYTCSDGAEAMAPDKSDTPTASAAFSSVGK